MHLPRGVRCLKKFARFGFGSEDESPFLISLVLEKRGHLVFALCPASGRLKMPLWGRVENLNRCHKANKHDTSALNLSNCPKPGQKTTQGSSLAGTEATKLETLTSNRVGWPKEATILVSSANINKHNYFKPTTEMTSSKG